MNRGAMTREPMPREPMPPGGFVARRLPVHAGTAGWNAILGPSPAPRPLRDDITADFTVIGAGFAGLSAARRLLQLDPAARIVVLDAGRVGEGAAGRNSGFMIDLPHDLTSDDYGGDSGSEAGAEGGDGGLIRLNRMAIAFARQAVEEYGIDPAHFDPIGKTNGAVSEGAHARNLSYAEHLRGLGEAHEMLDQRAMSELTGSRYYLSGLHTPGTVLLQPAGYIRGLAGGLSQRVAIHEESPVTGFEREGAGWRVRAPEGSVSTGRIILANNGQVESFGIARGRLMHIFLFASMTRELDAEEVRRLGGQGRWGITPSDPMGTTVRRIGPGQGGDRIVVRTCAEFCPGMETSASMMRRATRIMRGKFEERFPALGDVRMEHSWSGHLCLSRNGVSVTGEIEDGVFAACCQNGLGTARGTLTGIAAAETALGESSAVTRFFAGQPRPTRLPPAPLAKLGATAYLRWKEWRARKE